MTIRAEGIKKEFLRKAKGTNILTAVQECDITIDGGEFLVIKGRSGSGKSTLTNMLAGMLLPTEGRVLYDSMDIYAMTDEKLSEYRNKHIGFIPQGKSAISSLSVLENIMLPFTLFGDRDEATAYGYMERLDIAGLGWAMPDELSGGELRRMAVARALVRKPEVVFADEPTSDLDDENTKVVLDMLKEATRHGAAVIVVTHDTEAEAYADRKFRMDAGKLNET